MIERDWAFKAMFNAAMALPPSDFGSLRAVDSAAKVLRAAVEAEREACAALSAIVINEMRNSGQSDLRTARHRVETAIRDRSRADATPNPTGPTP